MVLLGRLCLVGETLQLVRRLKACASHFLPQFIPFLADSNGVLAKLSAEALFDQKDRLER